jgi:hypothetical protein
MILSESEAGYREYTQWTRSETGYIYPQQLIVKR